MNNDDQMALMMLLPGITAAIEKLTAERDMIKGALGWTTPKVKRVYTKRAPKTVEPPPESKYTPAKCDICGLTFKRAQGLSAHMRTTHATANKKHARKKAKPTVTPVAQHTCGVCQKTFQTKTGMLSHMRYSHPSEVAA